MDDFEKAVAKLLKDSRQHYPYAEIVPKRDITEIASLGRLCFGPHSFTVKKFESLLKANPNILWRVKGRDGTTEGYLDILPVKAAFADGLIAGTKKESDLQPSDVVAEDQISNDPDGVIYVAGIVISNALQSDSQPSTVRRLAAKLAVAAFDRIQHIYSRSTGFSRVVIMPYQRRANTAWSTIPYLTKLGFKQAGKSAEGFPVFELNLNDQHELENIFVLIGKRRAARRTRASGSKKYADKVIGFLKTTSVVQLAEKTIVGDCRLFDEQIINNLKTRVRQITDPLTTKTDLYENFLIWAAPGTGKTYLIEQIAKSLGSDIDYVPIDFAKMKKDEVVQAINTITNATKPTLVLYDEIDAKPDQEWPYDVSFKALDLNRMHASRRAVFVLIGSRAKGLQAMMRSMMGRPKGKDLLDRVPEHHRFAIPPMTVGDRAVVMLTQIEIAARGRNPAVNEVDKLAAYYVLSDEKRSPRQVTEFVKKAFRRIPARESSVAYDYFFRKDDAAQYQFWADHKRALEALQYTKLKLE